nr:EAL domain-containing protein [uncultured Devosia sp.]
MTQKFSTTRRNSFSTSSRALLSLVVVGGIATLVLVLISAVWAGRESDRAAYDRQRLLVESSLTKQLENVSNELELMANGYAATIDRITGSGEIIAFDGANFRSIITDTFGFEDAFVVWDNGDLALAAEDGVAARHKWIRPLMLPLLGIAVDTTKISLPSNDARPGAVEFMRLQGRPSIAGVFPIGAGDELGGRKLFLFAYKYVDGIALDAFREEQGLTGVRFSRMSDPDVEEVAYQVDATRTGEPIGFIIWTPDLPGSRVILGILPALGIAGLVIVCIILVLVSVLRRTLTDLRSSEQMSRHRSLHDVLTDLPNRALFARRLEETLQDIVAGEGAAVALIDLDRFKKVNDSLGHGAGDELIQAVARRMLDHVGPGDTLARLGGDEFALLLPSGESNGRDPLAVCESIVAQLRRPFPLLGGKAFANIGCSIGVARVSNSDSTPTQILHAADVALYEAKSAGRGRAVEFSESMDMGARSRERLKVELREVVDRLELDRDGLDGGVGLEVFYQTVHSANGENPVSGAEALVRWRHADRGLIGPDRFIQIAEETGLIHRLGTYVLRTACSEAMRWDDRLFVSVNVSPIQLSRAEFADEVLFVLEQTGLAPERLELEITESALLANDEMAEAAFTRLREYGVKIALDDFGTGYSSLSHLIRFGIDRIKIDRSFVRLLGSRSDGTAVVSAMVALGNRLGLSTTAEGVETDGQRDFLVAAGCTDLQGYLFSRPVPDPDLSRDVGSVDFGQSSYASANATSSAEPPVQAAPSNR